MGRRQRIGVLRRRSRGLARVRNISARRGGMARNPTRWARLRPAPVPMRAGASAVVTGWYVGGGNRTGGRGLGSYSANSSSGSGPKSHSMCVTSPGRRAAAGGADLWRVAIRLLTAFKAEARCRSGAGSRASGSVTAPIRTAAEIKRGEQLIVLNGSGHTGILPYQRLIELISRLYHGRLTCGEQMFEHLYEHLFEQILREEGR